MTTNDTIPTGIKEIRYNVDTRDYDLYLDQEYVGSRSTQFEASIELDRLAYGLAQFVAGWNAAIACVEPDGPSSPYPPQDVDGTPDPDPAPGRAA